MVLLVHGFSYLVNCHPEADDPPDVADGCQREGGRRMGKTDEGD